MSSKPVRPIEVVIAREKDRSLLASLLQEIHAGEAHTVRKAEGVEADGVEESLARYKALSSDSAWFLVALCDRKPVGYAALVRIPKLDRRIGFLYLDELHVLSGYRRCGVGTALMKRAIALTRELDLAGIRLLARPKNTAAQRFYEHLGFSRSESILYERSTGQDGKAPIE
jgi:ribosomal protein S18 acetylase RimI-like enzyme